VASRCGPGSGPIDIDQRPTLNLEDPYLASTVVGVNELAIPGLEIEVAAVAIE
jgi:hypothetical protein